MKELRLHGRGGQGAAMAAEMLATAFVKEGLFAHSFPLFGVERRGAPLASFVRYGPHTIRLRTRVYKPNSLIILDPALVNAEASYSGLQDGGTVVINSKRTELPEMVRADTTLATIDATGIALEVIGSAITNTCLLGAFARASGDLSLESVLAAIGEYFRGELAEKNQLCARRGYAEVQLHLKNGAGEV